MEGNSSVEDKMLPLSDLLPSVFLAIHIQAGEQFAQVQIQSKKHVVLMGPQPATPQACLC